MADRYALEQVGVNDGTLPAKLADGRLVNAKKRGIRASFPTGTAQAAADRLYLGRLPFGAVVTDISVVSDTSLGTSTISIGPVGTPTKYVNARTMTVTDTSTAIGPRAAVAAAAPLAAEEDLWLTWGVGGVGAAVIASVFVEYIISA